MGQLDTSRQQGCELCVTEGGQLVVRTPKLRVIRVLDADHPGFYRVIWNDHAAEFTDLPTADRVHLMDVVAKVESLVREHLQPTKINLASLGNVVPHLHWHVIARYADDQHFPQPIWGAVQRADSKPAPEVLVALPDLDRAIAEAVAHLRT
ncbi:HIT family protein [Aquabacterium sp.]|uniref:HIT family protein n=1 Tax=Aquabacterium sp. TaxID=1872578 RepID=UPI003D6D3ECA